MNNQQNFETLDILSILSFIAQMENIKKDNQQQEYIHSVIKAIAVEIEKLHKENDIIIQMLKDLKYGTHT